MYDEEEWIREYLTNTHLDTDYTLGSDQAQAEENELRNLIRFDDIDQNTSQILNIQYVDGHSYVVRNPFYGSDNHVIDKLKNEKNIYSLIKYHFRNPLSLRDLARIKIRNFLLKIDSKIKFRIERLWLPQQLKKYLLFEEFNL